MNASDIDMVVPTVERVTHAVALWIDRTFVDLRLTQAEAHVLAYLATHEHCSINDLHHSFGHRRSTLTSLLDRLERRGWIRRSAHPTSRRLVRVELTSTGRPVADMVSAAVRRLGEHLLARVGVSDIETFLGVMAALEEELR